MPKKEQLDAMKVYVHPAPQCLSQSLASATTAPTIRVTFQPPFAARTSANKDTYSDRATLYLINGTPIFFQHMTDPLVPHLKLIHRFPQAFPKLRIDRGAIRFVLSGATLMAPGLTSTGGRLPNGEEADAKDWGKSGEDMEAGEPVVIMAEGRERHRPQHRTSDHAAAKWKPHAQTRKQTCFVLTFN